MSGPKMLGGMAGSLKHTDDELQFRYSIWQNPFGLEAHFGTATPARGKSFATAGHATGYGIVGMEETCTNNTIYPRPLTIHGIFTYMDVVNMPYMDGLGIFNDHIMFVAHVLSDLDIWSLVAQKWPLFDGTSYSRCPMVWLP